MSSALSEWLSLREAADWAARADVLLDRIGLAPPAGGPLRVLDLCTGTGSNLRYLIDRLPPWQEWLAIDRDDALLSELSRRVREWAGSRDCRVSGEGPVTELEGERLRCRIVTRQLDLGRLDAEIFRDRHLVTASALLDLVSRTWLRQLARQCRTAGAAALFTITYDGRSTCVPSEPEDELVLDLFNRHQRTDKGLGGPAAGPDAPDAVERAFREEGYTVDSCPSDWRVPPRERELQRQLIEGWASAAAEIAPDRAGLIGDWSRRRLAHVESDRSTIVVHHRDSAAWLGP